MDRLATCMDALRVLAKSTDPGRAVLIEKYIDAYLTTETVSVWHALEELGKAIRDEHAQRREGASWSIAKEYVRSVLHRNALSSQKAVPSRGGLQIDQRFSGFWKESI